MQVKYKMFIGGQWCSVSPDFSLGFEKLLPTQCGICGTEYITVVDNKVDNNLIALYCSKCKKSYLKSELYEGE